MATENERGGFESTEGSNLENGSITIPAQAIRGVLALYGKPESFASERKFGGWNWWELIDLMEDPTKASRTKVGCCPPAVAKLFVELPEARVQLENMRQAAVAKIQDSIQNRIKELVERWQNGAEKERGGRSYRVLDNYGDDTFTTKWLAFLNGTLPDEKLYEMGIYICDLPNKDRTTVQAFAVDRLRGVSAETVQDWMRMPCVVVTRVESTYYPSGLENPSCLDRVPKPTEDTRISTSYSGGWYDTHGNYRHSGFVGDMGGRH